jgi:hypothetical protein
MYVYYNYCHGNAVKSFWTYRLFTDSDFAVLNRQFTDVLIMFTQMF